MRHRHDVEHRLERAGRGDADHVDVDLAQFVHHAVRHPRVQLGPVLGEADQPVGDHGERAAAVGEDPLDVGAAVERAAEQQAHDRAGGVERKFDRRRRDVGNDIERKARRGRMEIHHGLAPVELVEHLLEGVVAGILVHVVRRQRDAVGVERIEGIFDLAQAALDVRQRQRGEMAEPAPVIPLHLRRGLVDLAGEGPRRGGVAQPGARRRHRQHRHRDAVLVHRLDGLARLPVLQPVVEGVGGVLEHVAGLLDVDRRIGMMVGVDAVSGHSSTLGIFAGQGARFGGLSNRAGKHINSAKEYSGRKP